MSVEAVDTEDWTFKPFGPKQGFQIVHASGDSLDDSVGPVCLLAISPDSSKFAAGSVSPSQGEIVVGQTSDLHAALASNASELEPVVRESRRGVTHLEFLANGHQLVVATSDSSIELYDVPSLTLVSSLKVNGAVVHLKRLNKSQGFVFSTTADTIYKVDSESTTHVSKAASVFTVRTSDDEIVTSADGIELPSEAGDIKWIGETAGGQLAVVAVDADDDANYLLFVQNGTGLDDWLLIEDACPPYGDTSRPFAWYTAYATNYPNSSGYTSVSACSQSTDLLLVSNAQRLAVMDDSTTLPFTTEDEDVTTLGAVLDVGDQTTKVVNPLKGIDSATGLPLWLVLTQEGKLLAWHVVSRTAIESHAQSAITPALVDAPSITAIKPIEKTISEEEVEEISHSDAESVAGPTETGTKVEPEEAKEAAEQADLEDQVAEPGEEKSSEEPIEKPSEPKKGTSPFGGASFGSSWGSTQSWASSKESTPVNASPFAASKPAENASPFKSQFGSGQSSAPKESPFKSGGFAFAANKDKSPFAFASGDKEKPAFAEGKDKPAFAFGDKDKPTEGEDKPAFAFGDSNEKSPFALASGNKDKPAFAEKNEKSPFAFGSGSQEKSIFGSGDKTAFTFGAKPASGENKSPFGTSTSLFGKSEEQSNEDAGKLSFGKDFLKTSEGTKKDASKLSFGTDFLKKGEKDDETKEDAGKLSFGTEFLKKDEAKDGSAKFSLDKDTSKEEKGTERKTVRFSFDADSSKKDEVKENDAKADAEDAESKEDAEDSSKKDSDTARFSFGKDFLKKDEAKEDTGKLTFGADFLKKDTAKEDAEDVEDKQLSLSAEEDAGEETSVQAQEDSSKDVTEPLSEDESMSEEDEEDESSEEEDTAEIERRQRLETLINSTEWTEEVDTELKSLADVAKFSELMGLNDFDRIYGETNMLFQAIDQNLRVLENCKEYTATSEDDSVVVGEIPQLMNKFQVAFNAVSEAAAEMQKLWVEANKLADSNENELQTCSLLQSDLKALDADLSKDAYKLRPLPVASLFQKKRLEATYAKLYEKLRSAKEQALFAMVEHGDVPTDIGNLVIALDTIDNRLESLQKRVARIYQSNSRSLVPAITGLSLNDNSAPSIYESGAYNNLAVAPRSAKPWTYHSQGHFRGTEKFLRQLAHRSVSDITTVIDF